MRRKPSRGERADAIHNVVVRNVNACSRWAVVRLLNHYGHKLYNILIENIQCSVEVDPSEREKKQVRLQLPDCEKVDYAVEPVYGECSMKGRAERMSRFALGRTATLT